MKKLIKNFNVNNLTKTKNALTVLLTAVIISTTSCSKSDPTPEPVSPVLAPLQDPLAGYLTASGFSQKNVDNVNNDDYEFGYSFIPLVSGKMTAIVAKLPASRLAMRVTIWDKVTTAILTTETIDVATANVEVIKQITALDLVKDKEYFISMNSNDWYKRTRINNSSVTYPFTVGDIKITSYAFGNGTSQTMPIASQISYYAGDCSFKFQK